MLAPVVAQVAARAQCGQVRRIVVGGVLIEMGTGQDRFHEPPRGPIGRPVRSQRPPPLVVPLPRLRVQPAAGLDHPNPLAMGPATPLAAPAGPLEFDAGRQFPPVGRIQGAEVGMDGHYSNTTFGLLPQPKIEGFY